MPDMCLCRLVVSGPVDEVRRFVRAAAERPVRKRKGAKAATPEPLSFARLRPIANEEEADELYGTPWPEPMDPTRGRLIRRGATAGAIDYQFLTKWAEPAALVRFVSGEFPRLTFLLGAVAPAVGEANCWCFRGGRGRNWVMSSRLHEKMYTDMYKAAGLDPDDVDGDTELERDFRFDAALMDVVIAHWARTDQGHATLTRPFRI